MSLFSCTCLSECQPEERQVRFLGDVDDGDDVETYDDDTVWESTNAAHMTTCKTYDVERYVALEVYAEAEAATAVLIAERDAFAAAAEDARVRAERAEADVLATTSWPRRPPPRPRVPS